MTKSTVNHAQTIGLIKQQQQALNTEITIDYLVNIQTSIILNYIYLTLINMGLVPNVTHALIGLF